jgi:hypothetical protein
MPVFYKADGSEPDDEKVDLDQWFEDGGQNWDQE